VPRRGRAQADVAAILDGALAADGERIVYARPDRDLPSQFAGHRTAIDASSCAVVPGFVDAHTHAVFAGDRRDELRRRLAGATYAGSAAARGGCLTKRRAAPAVAAG